MGYDDDVDRYRTQLITPEADPEPAQHGPQRPMSPVWLDMPLYILPRNCPAIFPEPIKIRGGDADAHKDMFNRIVAHCVDDQVTPLFHHIHTTSISDAVLRVTSIHILGITHLLNANQLLCQRFWYEVLPFRDAHRIVTCAVNAVLPGLYRVMINNIARRFSTGELEEVNQYFMLAHQNARFDGEILTAIKDMRTFDPHLDSTKVESAWVRKDPVDFKLLHPMYQIEIPGRELTRSQVQQHLDDLDASIVAARARTGSDARSAGMPLLGMMASVSPPPASVSTSDAASSGTRSNSRADEGSTSITPVPQSPPLQTEVSDPRPCTVSDDRARPQPQESQDTNATAITDRASQQALPGESLSHVRTVGDNHYVYCFTDADGHEREVHTDTTVE